MTVGKIAWALGGLMTAAGSGLIILSNRPASPEITAPVRHFVTKEMETIATSWSKQVIPLSQAKLSNGSTFELKAALAKGPLYVYFIKDGCPCSVDAEPLFHRLFKKWGSKVTFIAVMDKDAAKCNDWKKSFDTPYGLIPDPELKVINSFKATNSTFSALVDKDGKVHKMWPGYSKTYLEEMNAEFAKMIGEAPGTIDTAYAPKEKTAGCAFPRVY